MTASGRFGLVFPAVLSAAVSLALAGPRASPEQSREQVEASIQAIHRRMREIRGQSPFTEPNPRESLEDIVRRPGRCEGLRDDKYCRLYDEVLKKKPGIRPEDVFAAFTAEEIIDHKLLQKITGCTGDVRVFHKLARETGLEVRRVASSVKQDYVQACYEGRTKLERYKPGAHLNGHGGMAVRWGGKWRLLDTSDYEKPSYARSGPAPRRELAVDDPEDLLGKEVYFGFPSDPYLVTAVTDRPDDAFTYRAVEDGGASGCRFAVALDAAQPRTACRFEGTTKFDDGVSLDFSCGRCYVHRSNMLEMDIAPGAACGVSRHETNGKGDIKDCACVSCAGGRGYAFYPGGCGGREAAELAQYLLPRVVSISTAPGDSGLVAERVRASLGSPMARDLGRRLVERGLPLAVEFGEQYVAGLWGSLTAASGTAKIGMVPAMREADVPAFSRVFWHEACHALIQSEAEAAGLYLWDLFFDDELYCYLAGEVIVLELGGTPERDEISLAMEASTAAFKDAMARQEENGALCREDLADPMSAWKRRALTVPELKRGARRMLSRAPVWRYRIRKVVGAGLIAEERLRSISFELDESERTRGGLDGILRLEAGLRRRLKFFSTGRGPWHIENLSRFLRTSALPERVHRDMVELQSRYRVLADERRGAGSAAQPASSEGPPAQADWEELTKAYDLLVARDPACCKDEPSYEREKPTGPPKRSRRSAP
ncbi:MAG: hypothetical protein HY748_01540 [Elusimicrobia bacterium]|nr:hypothetical protein [Elusimicrobiota bacterium]